MWEAGTNIIGTAAERAGLVDCGPSWRFYESDTGLTYIRNEAGNAWLGPVSVIGAGAGAAGRVAYWSGVNTLTSSANLVFDGTRLTVNASPGTDFTLGTFRTQALAAGTMYGCDLAMRNSAAGTAIVVGFRGLAMANVATPGTMASALGARAEAWNLSTGTLTLGTCFYAQVVNFTTGTITSGIGMSIATPSNAGTIGTAYGILIYPQTAALTNNYGIWIGNVAGGAAVNASIMTYAGNIIFNEGGDANTDFRHEGGTNTHLLFSDAGLECVGINQSTPAGKLDVYQSASGGAIPVLKLEQLDVSEEFIRLVGSAAAGVLTQSIVAEADVATATRVGWAKVYVQDDGNQISDQPYFIGLYTLA